MKRKKSRMMRVHDDFYEAVKSFQQDLERTTNSKIERTDITKLFASKKPSVMLVDTKLKRKKKKYEFTRLF